MTSDPPSNDETPLERPSPGTLPTRGADGLSARLDRPLFELLRSPPDFEPGARVGPYRIVSELGRGGSGTVYLATRADGEFDRRVAIKVLRRGMDTEEIVRRFRRERQILADLEHPNIARLFDGGTTTDERPFLVMEHVEGEPVDRFCARRRLGPTDRLRLFLQVCRAVSFAHQHLVVHRDLKPSNILVTHSGEPKLLDFGIAKLLDDDASLAVTSEGRRPMTPGYASPEQVLGAAITTASDVYSLGVLLYLLLTGQLPYRLGRGGESALHRRICEEPPARPSAVVRSGGDREVDRGRRLSGRGSRSHARRLRGDLDNVILMALRKEPERRYSTVDNLAADIERHLAGRPVAARPDTFLYRTGKLLRRRRREVILAAAGVVLLVAFGIDRWIQHAQVVEERNKARETSDFLMELFEISDPTVALSHRLSAREILDRGRHRLERRELERQPELRAALTQTIGTVYRSLGLYEEAAHLLEAALEQRRQLLENDDPEIAESLHELALLRLSTGDLGAAEKLFADAYGRRQGTFGRQSPEALASQSGLARTYWSQGRYREAAALLRPVARAQQSTLKATPELAEALHVLAVALRDLGDYERSETDFRQALAMRQDLLGDAHPDVAATLGDLALLHAAQGRLEEAETAQRRALAIQREVFGDEHPEVARCTNALASILRLRGEYAAGTTLLHRTLERFRSTYGDEHPRVPALLQELGRTLHFAADLEPAETTLREALVLGRRVWGERHPEVASIESDLATLLRTRSKLDEAEALSRHALELITTVVGEVHPHVATVLADLAEIVGARGDLEEAEALARRSLAMRRQLLGDGHPDIARGLDLLATLLRERGELAEAEALWRQALEVGRRAWGDDDHPYQLATLNNLATAVSHRGDAAGAEALYSRVLALYRREFGAGHPYTATALNNLAGTLIEQGKLDAAEPLVREALAIRRRTRGPEHPQVGISLVSLATLHLERREAEVAEPLLVEAVALLTAAYGDRHRRTAEAKSLLGECLARLGQDEEAEALLHEGYVTLRELLGDESPLVAGARRRLEER